MHVLDFIFSSNTEYLLNIISYLNEKTNLNLKSIFPEE